MYVQFYGVGEFRLLFRQKNTEALIMLNPSTLLIYIDLYTYANASKYKPNKGLLYPLLFQYNIAPKMAEQL